MREDMFKVIVERPRRHGDIAPYERIKYISKDPEVLENLPSKDGIRAGSTRRWNRKELNENLKPLVRYLHSQVGKPWDDVYSDICKNLSTGSTVQQHVRDHVFDYVEKRIVIGEDGKIYRHPGHRWWRIAELDDSLYIHPISGLLLYAGPRKRERRVEPESVRVIGENEYRKLNGIWYEVIFSPIPEVETVTYVDTVTGLFKTYQRRPAFHDVFAVSSYVSTHYRSGKRQLNSKELRALNLKNE